MKRSCLIVAGVLVAVVGALAAVGGALWFVKRQHRAATEIKVAFPLLPAGRSVVLELTGEGNVTLDGTPVAAEGLLDALQSVVRQDKNTAVNIRCAVDGPYAALMRVMDACHSAGLDQVSFTNTQSSD